MRAGRDNADVLEVALLVNRDAGSSGAQINNSDAIFPLAISDDGASGGNYRWNEAVGLDVGGEGGFFQILTVRSESGDDISAKLEPGTGHAKGILDAALTI